MFFFKQKTAYEMRISDWSSDVCSSDLTPLCPARRLDFARRERGRGGFDNFLNPHQQMFALPARHHRLIVEQLIILHREEDFKELVAEQVADLLARGEAVERGFARARQRTRAVIGAAGDRLRRAPSSDPTVIAAEA